MIYFIFLKPFIKTPIYITEHDIVYISRQSAMASHNAYGPINRFRIKIIKTFELFLLKYIADAVLVWGQDDRQELIQYIAKNKIIVIPPIIDKKRVWQPSHGNNFVFIGSSHRPNQDSLDFIVNNIWPYIKKLFNQPKLIIIGDAKTNLIDSNIVHLGFVDNYDDILRKTRALLAPIAWGAGIKVKILEAFSKGIPVITNKKGITNFDDFKLSEILVDKNITGCLLKYRNNFFLKKLSQQEIKLAEKYKPAVVIPKYLALYNNQN